MSKDLETKIRKMQTKSSEVNRKSADLIKEFKKLKQQINNNTDINGATNITDVSIDEDMNIKRNSGNEERFIIAVFVDFKKFITLESPSINK